jgi:hypothetical protein
MRFPALSSVPSSSMAPRRSAAEPLRPLDYLRSVVAVTAITVTAIRIAADVYPAVIGHPLHARIVTVAITAIVRPCGSGQRDASAYAPPRPETSTAKMPTAPITRGVYVRPRPRSRISSTPPSRRRRLRRAFASAQVADRPSADEGP